MSYVPLHVHSVFSPFEGMITLEELVERSSFFKFEAVALTDHWNTHGHYDFFRLAKKAGIKPILGNELQHSSLVGHEGLYHLTVFAENDTGYRNLLSLVTKHSAKEKGVYVTPDELAEFNEGLVVLSGCLKGEMAQAIIHGNLGRARDVVKKLLQYFGASNVFLEVMNHNLPEERLVGDHLAIISKRLGVPLVVTNNDRYLLREGADNFKILASMRNTEERKDAEEDTGEYYLKRDKDLEPFFYSLGDAINRSGEIAERCSVDLNRRSTVSFHTSPNPHETLADMCHRRFLLKFHGKPGDEVRDLRRRMEGELNSARREGLSAFLLFMRELFNASSGRGIWLELASGNLYESLIAYILDIIPLNPVEQGLIFESFSSSMRGTPLPVDFLVSEGRKEELVEIIKELLSECGLFFQITQEEMSLQTIVKEIAAVLNAPEGLREGLVRMLQMERRGRSLAAMLENSEALRQLYNSDETARRIVHAADGLRGRINHFVQNTSRIVLLPPDLKDAGASVVGPGVELFIQLGGAAIEALGGWVVGIQQSHFLSALERTIGSRFAGGAYLPALSSSDENSGTKWIPELLTDPKTFGLISSGETAGVYLLESRGIRDMLARIKPTTFEELVNVISLYRPAPLEGRLWQKYEENIEKKGKVYLPHHSLAAPLESTRGLLLYKEQVMWILSVAAGLRGGRAMEILGALERMHSGELMTARLEFIRGAMDEGLNEEDAQKVFDFLLHNVAFTHSKSLSVAQAYLSYRTAFLKAHLFEEYFVSLLNSNMDVRERQKRYMEYLESVDVRVLGADINASGSEFRFEEGGIRIPLQSVKSLEKNDREEILAERAENGLFASFEDFLDRMYGKLSGKAVENLIDEGFFEPWGLSPDEMRGICKDFFEGGGKAGLFTRVAKKASNVKKKKKPLRQLSFFDED